MRMKPFGCLGFDFSLTDSGQLMSNFTFRFPAKTGFYFHVPSYSSVNTIYPAIWDTQMRGGNRILKIRNYILWYLHPLYIRKDIIYIALLNIHFYILQLSWRLWFWILTTLNGPSLRNVKNLQMIQRPAIFQQGRCIHGSFNLFVK